jgi:hypothetical protein
MKGINKVNENFTSIEWKLLRIGKLGLHQRLRAACTLFVGLVLLVVLPACSSTHVKSTPNSAGMSSAPYRNVTVVAVEARPDFRNPFENDAAGFLREHGVVGAASHDRFTLDQMKGNREQIRQLLAAANAESVLFVRVTDQSDSAAGAPPASLGSLDMGAVDESRYNALTMPGGSDNFNVRLSARLYRVSDGAVVWTGMMDTIVKEDFDSIVVLRGIAKTIVERMATDKVIP